MALTSVLLTSFLSARKVFKIHSTATTFVDNNIFITSACPENITNCNLMTVFQVDLGEPVYLSFFRLHALSVTHPTASK